MSDVKYQEKEVSMGLSYLIDAAKKIENTHIEFEKEIANLRRALKGKDYIKIDSEWLINLPLNSCKIIWEITNAIENSIKQMLDYENSNGEVMDSTIGDFLKSNSQPSIVGGSSSLSLASSITLLLTETGVLGDNAKKGLDVKVGDFINYAFNGNETIANLSEVMLKSQYTNKLLNARLTEGMGSFGETVIDGGATIFELMFSNLEALGINSARAPKEAIGDFVKKDHIGDLFESSYKNVTTPLGIANKYSVAKYNSLEGNLAKLGGFVGGAVILSVLAAPAFASTLGASWGPILGDTAIAFTSGLGSGNQAALLSGKDYETALNAALLQGGVEGAITFGLGALFKGLSHWLSTRSATTRPNSGTKTPSGPDKVINDTSSEYLLTDKNSGYLLTDKKMGTTGSGTGSGTGAGSGTSTGTGSKTGSGASTGGSLNSVSDNVIDDIIKNKDLVALKQLYKDGKIPKSRYKEIVKIIHPDNAITSGGSKANNVADNVDNAKSGTTSTKSATETSPKTKTSNNTPKTDAPTRETPAKANTSNNTPKTDTSTKDFRNDINRILDNVDDEPKDVKVSNNTDDIVNTGNKSSDVKLKPSENRGQVKTTYKEPIDVNKKVNIADDFGKNKVTVNEIGTDVATKGESAVDTVNNKVSPTEQVKTNNIDAIGDGSQNTSIIPQEKGNVALIDDGSPANTSVQNVKVNEIVPQTKAEIQTQPKPKESIPTVVPTTTEPIPLLEDKHVLPTTPQIEALPGGQDALPPGVGEALPGAGDALPGDVINTQKGIPVVWPAEPDKVLQDVYQQPDNGIPPYDNNYDSTPIVGDNNIDTSPPIIGDNPGDTNVTDNIVTNTTNDLPNSTYTTSSSGEVPKVENIPIVDTTPKTYDVISDNPTVKVDEPVTTISDNPISYTEIETPPTNTVITNPPISNTIDNPTGNTIYDDMEIPNTGVAAGISESIKVIGGLGGVIASGASLLHNINKKEKKDSDEDE